MTLPAVAMHGVGCLAIFLSICLTTCGWTATTAEMLGYPQGSRLLILHATEAGICWESNQAIKGLVEAGIVKSASVVATGPWCEEFIEWARTRPQLDVGVCLALHNPYPNVRWRFAAPPETIRSLVDNRGFPCVSAMQMAMNASTEDVEREFIEQLHVAREAGLKVSHFATLEGAAFSRTDFTAVLLTLARTQWTPAPVVELTPAKLERFRSMGLELEDTLLDLVVNYPLPKLDDIEFVPKAKNYQEFRDAFCQQLRKQAPGLVQITISPLVESDGIKLMDPNWQRRVWETELFTDPVVQATFKETQIQIVTWREIMDRFENKGAVTTESSAKPKSTTPAVDR